MTGDIFDVLEMRFNSNPTLVTVGRKLYEGFDEERVGIVRPYTEVNLDKTDSFGTWNADIDAWDVRFRYHAKDPRTVGADLWLAGIRAMFKDAGVSLNCAAFVCCGCKEGSAEGPRNKTSAYDAAIRFRLTVQWRQLSPSIRGG